MSIWKEETPKQFIGSLIWNASEKYKVPLGRFSLKVFNWMMGSKGNKQN